MVSRSVGQLERQRINSQSVGQAILSQAILSFMYFRNYVLHKLFCSGLECDFMVLIHC